MPKQSVHCQVNHQMSKILCQLTQNMTTDCLLNHMFDMCYFTPNCFDPIRMSEQRFKYYGHIKNNKFAAQCPRSAGQYF